MKMRRTIPLPATLEAILTEDDDLGLLADVQPVAAPRPARESQAVINFKELVAFYEAHQREPDNAIMQERGLAIRLEAYRNRRDLRQQVLPYDTAGLLQGKVSVKPVPPKEPTTLEDILANDDMELLGDVDSTIFTLNHTVRSDGKEKDQPDEIACRKPCEDFYRYEKMFQDIQKAVQEKRGVTERFSRKSDASVGQVFILRGLLCYVDSIIDAEAGGGKHYNPRLRVVFANGTETDFLKLSLARALYKDPHSRRVDMDPNLLTSGTASIKGQPTGYIYILATESTAPALAALKGTGKLVKIGYSTQEVRERIKNAENDRTYLEAPVRLLAQINCFNLNPQKFENLIHAFLYQQRIHISLTDKNGTTYHPEEWFAVDRDTAVAICERIVDGTITQYRMDKVQGVMVKKG